MTNKCSSWVASHVQSLKLLFIAIDGLHRDYHNVAKRSSRVNLMPMMEEKKPRNLSTLLLGCSWPTHLIHSVCASQVYVRNLLSRERRTKMRSPSFSGPPATEGSNSTIVYILRCALIESRAIINYSNSVKRDAFPRTGPPTDTHRLRRRLLPGGRGGGSDGPSRYFSCKFRELIFKFYLRLWNWIILFTSKLLADD